MAGDPEKYPPDRPWFESERGMLYLAVMLGAMNLFFGFLNLSAGSDIRDIEREVKAISGKLDTMELRLNSLQDLNNLRNDFQELQQNLSPAAPAGQ